MARIKKFGSTLDPKLGEYGTLVIDTDPSSLYFKITSFKDTFVSGKNLFYIEGSSFLREDTPVKIDIRDAEGRPIYYEPGTGTPEYYNGISKVISVHIYDDTPIGSATITIIGELSTYIDSSGVIRPVPDEWVGMYNVLWQRSFTINRLLPNEDPVIFYNTPVVSIEEIQSPVPYSTISENTISGTASGFPIEPTSGFVYDNYAYPSKYLIKNSTNLSNFTSDIINSKINFADIDYTSHVIDVVNDNTILVKRPYTLDGVVSEFKNEPYTIVHKEVSTQPSFVTGSFAKIHISNLRTFTGDVKRLKILKRSLSDISDYQIIQDIPIDSTEVLTDYDTTSTGIFYGRFSPTYYEYWDTGSVHPMVSPQFDNSFLYNSVRIVNSIGGEISTSDVLTIDSGSEYTFSMNVRYSGTIDSSNKIDVFLSGSLPNGIPYSQHITTVYSNYEVLQKTLISKNIIADNLENVKLYLKFTNANWYASDVSLRTASEFGFSPDVVTIVQPIDRIVKTESFEFVFQFYDINNNFIPVYVEDSITFKEGNVIDDGISGIGIIFRGEWATGTSYVLDFAGKRRDAVYYEGQYYAARQTNVGNTPIPPPNNDDDIYWEYLGDEDFFVAAKIAIFEQSTVKSRLTVGVNPLDSIIIEGGTTAPYISIGQVTPSYGAEGIFIGYTTPDDSGVESGFSIRAGDNYIRYLSDGSGLEISGSISADTGRIGGFAIESTQISASVAALMSQHPTPPLVGPSDTTTGSDYWGFYSNPYNYLGTYSQGNPEPSDAKSVFSVGDDTQYLRFTGDRVEIQTPTFRITNAGGFIENMEVSGQLTWGNGSGSLGPDGIRLTTGTVLTSESAISFNGVATIYSIGDPSTSIFNTTITPTGRLTLTSTSISSVWSPPSIVLRNDAFIDITGRVSIFARTPSSSVTYSTFLNKYVDGDFWIQSQTVVDANIAFNHDVSIKNALSWNNSNAGNGNVGYLTSFETSPTIRLVNVVDTSFFGIGNTVPLEISVSGLNNWYVCRDTSTIKVKDVVGEWNIDPLDVVNSIQVKQFYYKTDIDKTNLQVGFIAEDFHDYGIYPAVIYTNVDDTPEVAGVNRKTVDAILWQSVQKLTSQIATMNNTILDLKTEIQHLKS